MSDTYEEPKDAVDENGEGLDETQSLAGLLGEYKDILTDYGSFAATAQRFSETPDVIDRLNEHIAINGTDAFYSEITMSSTMYTFDEEHDEWSLLVDFLAPGKPHPFIADRLVMSADGRLLLADTARQIAVAGFTNLQLRPKTDEAVQEFSNEQVLHTMRKLGEVAVDNRMDRTPTMSTDRWDRVVTDPDVSQAQ